MTNDQKPRWLNEPTEIYCIKAEFADGQSGTWATGKSAYTTVEFAADRLEFIDRDKGIGDLLDGMKFQSHMGTTYQLVR